ncbi:nitrilase-related carbon-nitrogen hydrolase [Streptomyces sp. NPDC004629]|uniref:nitrilase-related carbon-nitrogen hydrolase n=1 Tax=Streptomyces sp. NPDC004629 TaxID=3364705 RepID=UPI0036C86699
MSTLKIATTQFELRAERSSDHFLAHVEGLVAKAAEQGAELILFPELASTGLLGAITDHTVTTKTIQSDYWNVLPTFTDDIVAGLRRIAAEHDIIVVGGSHNRVAEDKSLRNTAYVVHPDGRIESQDKLHLTPQERDLGARGGDDLLITEIGPFTVGLLICADIQYPELSRHLMRKGVDLILCPSLTWNRRGVHRVRTGCQARAIENQLYVVHSPLIGHSGLPEDAPMYAVGKALVTGPVDKTVGKNDGIMGITQTTEEDVLVVDLDHDLLLASREKPEAPGLKLHRPDLYAKLLSSTD